MRLLKSHRLPRLTAAIVMVCCARAGVSHADSSGGFTHSLRPSHSLDAQRPQQILPHQWLDDEDHLATLQAIKTALDLVGDGDAYVWRRQHGLLSGTIRPTTSFKATSGDVCRHIVIRLNSRHYWRQIEGIACRGATGVWSLSG